MDKEFNSIHIEINKDNYDMTDHNSNLRFLFHNSLDEDELVINLNAKNDIISILQQSEIYINEANLVLKIKKQNELESILNDLTSNNKNLSEKAASNLQKVSDIKYLKKYSDINLDFEELAQFSYNVATSKGFVYNKHKGIKSDYLDEGISELNESYEKLSRKGIINPKYFNYNMRLDIAIANDSNKEMKIRQHALNQLFKKSTEELNKSGTYMQLSDLKKDILSFSKNKNISETQITTLSKYFKSQAEIKSLMFKMSYHLCLMISGDEKAFKETKKVYNSARQMYNEMGLIHLEYIPPTKY